MGCTGPSGATPDALVAKTTKVARVIANLGIAIAWHIESAGLHDDQGQKPLWNPERGEAWIMMQSLGYIGNGAWSMVHQRVEKVLHHCQEVIRWQA